MMEMNVNTQILSKEAPVAAPAATSIPCPFTYANGRACCGVVYRARAYGPSRDGHHVARADVRKYRLWCSEKDDHAGAVNSTDGKWRMEFYPDQMSPGVEDQLWQGDLLN
jgi:hypothetical protein